MDDEENLRLRRRIGELEQRLSDLRANRRALMEVLCRAKAERETLLRHNARLRRLRSRQGAAWSGLPVDKTSVEN